MNTPSVKVTLTLVHGFLLGFVMTLPWLAPAVGLTAESAVRPVCWLLVGLLGWALWSWRRCAGSWFDPYSLFFLAAFLFNGGQALLEVCGLNRDGLLDGAFSAETTLAALYLTLLGLAAMHWGALMSAAAVPSSRRAVFQTASSERRFEKPPYENNSAAPARLPDETVRRVGWALVLVSLPFNVLLLWEAVTVVLSSGYFALYQREMPTGLGAAGDVLAHFLIPGVLFVAAGSKGSRVNLTATALILTAYALTQIFLGYRYYAAMPVIAYAWLWHRHVRPLPVALLAAGAAALLALFTLVQLTRDTAGEERLSVEYLQNAWSNADAPLVSSVREMGSTLGAVAHTLELVPERRPYELGESYGYALLTLVPNFFWDVHPSSGDRLPSEWLVWEVDPGLARAGGGLGFSFLAEAYLNFGWAGAPAVLWLLGLLYARFVLWAERSREPARLATVAAFAATFTLIARGEAALFVRVLVWYVLAPYAVIVILSWRPRFRGIGFQPVGLPDKLQTYPTKSSG